jgi:TusA-related sulfurtransferase
VTVEPIALVVDCRDDACPLPVIALARHLEEVAVGEVLAVLAHDPAARVDVPAWCRMRGHEFVGTDLSADGVPRHSVRRLA